MRTRLFRLRMPLGVLVALGLLLLVGRLSLPHSRPSTPPPSGTATSTVTTATAPTTSAAVVAHPTPRRQFKEPISALAVTPGAVWVAHGQTVSRLDPHTLRSTATVTGYRPQGDQQLLGMSASAGAVWVTVFGVGVLRIDPTSARVVARVPVVTEAPPAAGTGAVWAELIGPRGPWRGASQVELATLA